MESYDVIVIGAGMAGLLTAYYLQQEGKDILILEVKEPASGQTGRTTAKITSQHGLKYTELTDKIGSETAYLYAKANEEAIDQYEELIKKESIDCHFERVSSYLYTRDKNKISDLKREVDLAFLYDINAHFTKETEFPFEAAGTVCFENQAQFDADSFVKFLSSKLNIKENSKVIKIRGNKCIVEHNCKIEQYNADNIVVATHYPFKNISGFYFLRQHQERSYVAALSGCEKVKGMYCGIDKDGISLRQKGNLLLFGSGSRRTGEHTCADSYHKLLEQIKVYYPYAKVEDLWSAQDCMPHDGIPFIGRYSVFTPHLYVATGFQKWGMSTSMVAAQILRDKICDRKNEYEKVFSPQRIHIRAGWLDFRKDIVTSIKGLWRGLLNGKILKEVPCCTHLGCGLHFNREEQVWECACHGSRFDIEGNVRDNPAERKLDLKGNSHRK